MAAMKQTKKEIYLATLQNGKRLMVIPEERPEWDTTLTEKKRIIIDDLNKKLDNKVVAVKFYGIAEIDKTGRYNHNREDNK